MTKIKYSIIVPAYNVEKYLEQCIKSILDQDFNNFEIIIIDDGSTDMTGKICDDLEKEDKRIKILHKKNGGLSDARNAGLEIACGEYTIFLDSDDFWIDKEFLKNVNNATSDKDVIIFNSYKFYDKNSTKKPRFKLSNDFASLNDNEKIKYVIKNNIYKACAWDKIVKTSILKDKHISFSVGVLSEDMEWCAKILSNIKKIDVYPNIVYAYRQRKNSISKSVGKKHLNDIYNQINNGIKIENKIILNYFAYEYVILYTYAFALNDKNIIKKTKNLSWLLKYNLSKKVKKIYCIYSCFGYYICGKILKKYLNLKR